MIVIIETNFILQIVLQQEHSAACEELLGFCSDSGGAQLAIPAFAVAEAAMVMERRQGLRKKFLQDDVRPQVEESGRSKLLRRFASVVNDLNEELLRADAEEASRWLDFRTTVLHSAHVISLATTTLDEALAIQVGNEIIKFPDALIFASIKEYLQELRARQVDTPAYFLSTDREFGTDAVLQQLRKLNCTYITSFENAASRIRNKRSPRLSEPSN